MPYICLTYGRYNGHWTSLDQDHPNRPNRPNRPNWAGFRTILCRCLRALWSSLDLSGAPCSDLAKGRRDEKTSWTCMDQMPQPRIFRYHMVSRRNDWQLTIGSLEMGEGEKGESATAINQVFIAKGYKRV